MMSLDTEVLIIGAGMSGIGLAVQLVRTLGHRKFTLIEKSTDVGGTWLANTYPGCGCDVASHFYSYSFALNPDWSKKYSMQPEIQAYFHSVAEQYDILPHVRFQSIVEEAVWQEDSATWLVTIKNQTNKETYQLQCKALISAVGSLSVPNPCDIPGAEDFQGPLFHSAQWDSTLDWRNKEIVVIGNGCSATQFVPIMTTPGDGSVKKLTQFARQAHFLSERENPSYSPLFKQIMRYIPLAMRLYRFKLYADMEKDFAGFDMDTGASIRATLKATNESYIKANAPPKYWPALLPRHEIGCKRKVLDTDYLASLWRPTQELITTDPIARITTTGVVTASGRAIHADAIILATGFATHRLLSPMQIRGLDTRSRNNNNEKNSTITLNEYWDIHHAGAPQAYMGTCIPGFPNFFTLMGPNTVTGHLSVIYTVECQINMTISLLSPILQTSPPSQLSWLLLPKLQQPKRLESVNVLPASAQRDSHNLQQKLSRLVWASGCSSWALHPDSGVNIAMYPEYQFWFWWRSVFIPVADFEYAVAGMGLEKGLTTTTRLTVGGWRTVQRVLTGVVLAGVVVGGVGALGGLGMGRHTMEVVQGLTNNAKSQYGKYLLKT